LAASKKVTCPGGQESQLVALHNAGEHTSSEIAELFAVARSTVYRAIARSERQQQDQPVRSAVDTDE